MVKKALITGITGQDGSYLAEFLLERGYEVHGIIRRSSSFNTGRIDKIYKGSYNRNKNLYLHYGDLSDSGNITKIIQEVQPDEIYNLAAQSHVQVSFEIPEYTANIDALGTLRILEAIRLLGMEKKVKFYQASTSELYGKVQEVPQTEKTPFYPVSPYAIAKLYSFWIVKSYREAYGLFACNGILFNHESPKRGETFVTKKITKALCRMKKGNQDCLYIGNLNARRDWGYARDYVEGMWLMLQQEKPKDYVLATGETHTVREFIEESCNLLDIELEWKGEGLEEVGINKRTGEIIIRIAPEYFRPLEVDILLGDSKKAQKELGWIPKTNFKKLVKLMIESDLKDSL